MASATFTVLGGQVVDAQELILEELRRVNAAPETIAQNMPFTTDVKSMLVPPAAIDPIKGGGQQAPLSAFIKQYLADIGAASVNSPGAFGPGSSTGVRLGGNSVYYLANNQVLTVGGVGTTLPNIIGLPASTSPTLPTPPPASTIGIPPPLGGSNLIFTTNNPAFVGGDLGTVILAQSATQDPAGMLSQIVLGSPQMAADMPAVRMTGDWQQEQQEDY